MADLVGTLELDARQGMADVLNQANSLAPQLADVNVRIKDATVPGVSYPSGDLLDERDRITSKLQELIGGTTTINEDGTASYSVDGVQLVDRVRSNRFSLASGASTITANAGLPGSLYLAIPAFPVPATQLNLSTTTDLLDRESINLQINNKTQVSPLKSTTFKDGQAGAYALLLQNFVPTLQKSLNLLAVELVNKVNTIPTGTSPSPTIAPIFGFKSTTGVADSTSIDAAGAPANVIALLNNSSISYADLLDANSTKFNTSALQDARNAFDLWIKSGAACTVDARNFKSVAVFAPSQFTGKMTSESATSLEALRSSFTEPVTFITSSVANTIATWNNQHKTNETMSQVLSDQKNAISGVNLDEEAANLVKYQQLYNAASKLIQTNRQMFDTLLAMLAGN